ncbi:MAG: DUF1569 domain-containing protein [Phycisphaerales bacterium]|nr:DUF1569 domain-containing protein [Phycisphaerales bacterium]
MAVDTKHINARRTLHFASIEDALRDARTLADADARGTLKPVGNWTLGQAFGHVAGWIEFALGGYPPELRPPWFVKLLVRPFKSRYLKALPPGVRIPRIAGGTLNTEVMPTQEGLARLTAAWNRLSTTPPTHENPIFGPMAHDEWISLNLRHAELHQGFFLPA